MNIKKISAILIIAISPILMSCNSSSNKKNSSNQSVKKNNKRTLFGKAK